jgi:nucleotide-binding universal stress UspA family protein
MAMAPIHTILHPTDFSEHSAYALEMACALARDYGARIIVLHVEPLPVLAFGEGVIPPDPENIREAAREQLDRLVLGPMIHAENRFEDGDPATVIVEVAHEVNADLIVMGTHGRRGLARLLLSSVAEQVGRQAPCPVLTVRTPFAKTVPVAAEALVEAVHP